MDIRLLVPSEAEMLEGVYSHIPIIAVTADLSSEAQSRGCTVGFNDFFDKANRPMPKPFCYQGGGLVVIYWKNQPCRKIGQLGNPYTMTGYQLSKKDKKKRFLFHKYPLSS